MKLKIYYVLSIFLLGIFIFSLRVDTAVAQDDDGDNVDDDLEDLNIRTVEIEWETDRFEIESTMRSGNVKNEIEFEVEYNSGGLSIENEYNTDNGTSEFELEFEVEFKKLIEYNDTVSDGMYNSSEDEMVQEVELNSFQSPIYSTSDLSANTKLHYIIVNTTDGIFTAYIYVVEEFALVNNSIITPFQVKVDIEINNFNFLSPISRLALYTKLESEAEYEKDDKTEDEVKGYATNEVSYTATANGTTGFFSWAETAEVDGVSKDVLVSIKEVDDDNPNNEKIYINYERGTHIYHDPKIGMADLIQSPRSSSSSSSSDDNETENAIPGFEIVILLGIAFLTVMGIIYRKQKKINVN